MPVIKIHASTCYTQYTMYCFSNWTKLKLIIRNYCSTQMKHTKANATLKVSYRSLVSKCWQLYINKYKCELYEVQTYCLAKVIITHATPFPANTLLRVKRYYVKRESFYGKAYNTWTDVVQINSPIKDLIILYNDLFLVGTDIRQRVQKLPVMSSNISNLLSAPKS